MPIDVRKAGLGVNAKIVVAVEAAQVRGHLQTLGRGSLGPGAVTKRISRAAQ